MRLLLLVAVLLFVHVVHRWWRRGAYRRMLQTDQWQRRRAAYYSRHEKRCSARGWHWGPIDLHHKVYLPGRRPEQYGDRFLEPLCRRHHRIKHGR